MALPNISDCLHGACWLYRMGSEVWLKAFWELQGRGSRSWLFKSCPGLGGVPMASGRPFPPGMCILMHKDQNLQ